MKNVLVLAAFGIILAGCFEKKETTSTETTVTTEAAAPVEAAPAEAAPAADAHGH